MKNTMQWLFAVAGICLLTSLAMSADPKASEPEDESIYADPKAILEMGKKGDRAEIARLKRLRAGRDKSLRGPAASAQMALAKLGEKQEMQEIVNESKSDDPEVRSAAIQKLAYVGDKEAVRALVAQLDDTKYKRKQWKGPDGKMHWGHVVFGPPSFEAMKALSEVMPDTPEFNRDRPEKSDVEKWKKWWEKNRRKYE